MASWNVFGYATASVSKLILSSAISYVHAEI